MSFYTFRQEWPLYYKSPNFARYIVIEAKGQVAANAKLEEMYLEETGCKCKHCKHNYILIDYAEHNILGVPKGAEARIFRDNGTIEVIDGWNLDEAEYLFREGTGKLAMSIKVTGAEFRDIHRQLEDEDWELYDLENLNMISS